MLNRREKKWRPALHSSKFTLDLSIAVRVCCERSRRGLSRGFQPVIDNLRQPRRLSALTGQEARLPTAIAAKFTTPTAPPRPAAAGVARASRASSDGALPFPAIWRALFLSEVRGRPEDRCLACQGRWASSLSSPIFDSRDGCLP